MMQPKETKVKKYLEEYLTCMVPCHWRQHLLIVKFETKRRTGLHPPSIDQLADQCLNKKKTI